MDRGRTGTGTGLGLGLTRGDGWWGPGDGWRRGWGMDVPCIASVHRKGRDGPCNNNTVYSKSGVGLYSVE